MELHVPDGSREIYGAHGFWVTETQGHNTKDLIRVSPLNRVSQRCHRFLKRQLKLQCPFLCGVSPRDSRNLGWAAVPGFYLRRSRQVLRANFPGFFLICFFGGDISFLKGRSGIMRPIRASKTGPSRQLGPLSPNLASVLTSEVIAAAASQPRKVKLDLQPPNRYLGTIWAAESNLASEAVSLQLETSNLHLQLPKSIHGGNLGH